MYLSFSQYLSPRLFLSPTLPYVRILLTYPLRRVSSLSHRFILFFSDLVFLFFFFFYGHHLEEFSFDLSFFCYLPTLPTYLLILIPPLASSSRAAFHAQALRSSIAIIIITSLPLTILLPLESSSSLCAFASTLPPSLPSPSVLL